MIQQLSATTRVTATRDQVSAEIADETVILHLGDGLYYSLSPVAARIWSLLQTPITVAEIHDTILREYEVAAEQCERDVMNLLRELDAQRLIEVVSDRA